MTKSGPASAVTEIEQTGSADRVCVDTGSLTVAGRNLWMWTKYEFPDQEGLGSPDPEVNFSSLSAYALIAMGQDRRALTSSYQYLIMGSVGATFVVIGIGLMYAMTGTLNMADLADRLPAVMDTRTVPVAFAFLTVGFSLKLALFPLHLWLPNAYTFAPSAVTAFMASTATKVAVYMMLRFFFTIFGAAFAFDVMQVDLILLPLAVVGWLLMGGDEED